jgi:hypothetical protein
MLNEREYEARAKSLRESGDLIDKYGPTFVTQSSKAPWHAHIEGNQAPFAEKYANIPSKLRDDVTISNSNGDFKFQREEN